MENNDKYYVTYKSNATHKIELVYFVDLCNNFEEDFNKNLFTFIMTKDNN